VVIIFMIIRYNGITVLYTEKTLVMNNEYNQFNQPVGHSLPHWNGCDVPTQSVLNGQYCRLERVSAAHADDLFEAYQLPGSEKDWTYLPAGPFNDRPEFERHFNAILASVDPLHYAVVDLATGKAIGTVALMRIDAKNGVIEMGWVVYSRALMRTSMATEAQFLLMSYVMDNLHYRRYEWKCDSLNEGSRKAALRLGFKFEGLFRNATVYKGRTRDTAWFSIIDEEWPEVRNALVSWLSSDNFDNQGQQRQSLNEIRNNNVA
jgi:RimJ/RimL family protein N-acetyltransferase